MHTCPWKQGEAGRAGLDWAGLQGSMVHQLGAAFSDSHWFFSMQASCDSRGRALSSTLTGGRAMTGAVSASVAAEPRKPHSQKPSRPQHPAQQACSTACSLHCCLSDGRLALQAHQTAVQGLCGSAHPPARAFLSLVCCAPLPGVGLVAAGHSRLIIIACPIVIIFIHQYIPTAEAASLQLAIDSCAATWCQLLQTKTIFTRPNDEGIDLNPRIRYFATAKANIHSLSGRGELARAGCKAMSQTGRQTAGNTSYSPAVCACFEQSKRC